MSKHMAGKGGREGRRDLPGSGVLACVRVPSFGVSGPRSPQSFWGCVRGHGCAGKPDGASTDPRARAAWGKR